jgi:replicative DNA helicase
VSRRIVIAPEAETALLAALLLRPAHLEEVRAIIGPDDFAGWWARQVYESILTLAQWGDPVDLVTVEAEMARRPGHDQDDTRARLIGLGCPSSTNAVGYARLVAKTARRRRLQLDLEAAIEAIEAGALVEDVLCPLQKWLEP